MAEGSKNSKRGRDYASSANKKIPKIAGEFGTIGENNDLGYLVNEPVIRSPVALVDVPLETTEIGFQEIRFPTLTDIIHGDLYKIALLNLNTVVDSPKLPDVVRQCVDKITEVLIDPRIDTDKKLVEGLQKLDFNEEMDSLAASNNSLALELWDFLFNISYLDFNYTNKGDRFVNQEGGPMAEPIYKSHKEKDPRQFIELNLPKSGGVNGGTLVLKRILEPGVLKEGRVHVSNKQDIRLSESKYYSLHLLKFSKPKFSIPSNLRRLFLENRIRYNNSQEMKAFVDRDCSNEANARNYEPVYHQMTKVLDAETSYKIRKVNGSKDSQHPNVLQIKLIPNTTTIGELFERRGQDVDALMSSIDNQSMVKTLLLNYFLGVGDRFNGGNTVVDERGTVYSIDPTSRQGLHHNERIKQSLEGIKNSKESITKGDINRLKAGIMEALYEEMQCKMIADRNVKFKTTHFTPEERAELNKQWLASLVKKSLEIITDEDFLNILYKIVTPEKIEQIKKIYEEHMENTGKNEVGLDGRLLNYNPVEGLGSLLEALGKMKYTSQNNGLNDRDGSLRR